MKKLFFLVLALVLALFSGCSSDYEGYTGDPDKGAIRLSTLLTVGMEVEVTRADMTGFTLILDGPEYLSIPFPADNLVSDLLPGEYDITVTSNEDGMPAAGFDTPYYYGTGTATVEAGTTAQSSSITCEQLNAGVLFAIDDSVYEEFPNFVPTVAVGGETLVYSGTNQAKTGFFAPGQATVTAKDGTDNVLLGGQQSQALTIAEKKIYRITLYIGEPGTGAISLNVAVIEVTTPSEEEEWVVSKPVGALTIGRSSLTSKGVKGTSFNHVVVLESADYNGVDKGQKVSVDLNSYKQYHYFGPKNAIYEFSATAAKNGIVNKILSGDDSYFFVAGENDNRKVAITGGSLEFSYVNPPEETDGEYVYLSRDPIEFFVKGTLTGADGAEIEVDFEGEIVTTEINAVFSSVQFFFQGNAYSRNPSESAAVCIMQGYNFDFSDGMIFNCPGELLNLSLGMEVQPGMVPDYLPDAIPKGTYNLDPDPTQYEAELIDGKYVWPDEASWGKATWTIYNNHAVSRIEMLDGWNDCEDDYFNEGTYVDVDWTESGGNYTYDISGTLMLDPIVEGGDYLPCNYTYNGSPNIYPTLGTRPVSTLTGDYQLRNLGEAGLDWAYDDGMTTFLIATAGTDLTSYETESGQDMFWLSIYHDGSDLLPAGTYTADKQHTKDPFTIEIYDFDDMSYSPEYMYWTSFHGNAMNSDDEYNISAFMAEGTVVVEHLSGGNYKITIDMSDDHLPTAFRVTGVYEGPVSEDIWE